MRHRHLILSILCYLTLSPTIMIAEAPSNCTGKLLNSRAGALEFRIQNLKIYSFEGGTISYKKYLKGSKAFRVGISLVNSRLSEEQDRSVENDFITIDSTIAYTSQSSVSSGFYEISINTQYLRYFNPQDDFHSYIGFGPILGIGLSSSENTSVRNPVLNSVRYLALNNVGRKFRKPRATNRSVIPSSIFTGITTSMGVEWFCRKNISLLAEYHAAFLIGRRIYESSSKQTNKSVNGNNGYIITSTAELDGYFYSVNSSVRLGISIHF